MERVLAGCALSIHLVGESYGAVPDGPSQKSVMVLQNELAVQRSKSDKLSTCDLAAPGHSLDAAAAQAFINVAPGCRGPIRGGPELRGP